MTLQIREIYADNFKSFKEMKLTLGPLNIIAGANGAGKSNFIELLQFFGHVEEHGLWSAISMHGGKEYFRNLQGDDLKCEFGISFVYDHLSFRGYGRKFFPIHELEYRFSFSFFKRKEGVKITSEHISIGFTDRRRARTVEMKRDERGKVSYPENIPEDIQKDFGLHRLFTKIGTDELLISIPFNFPIRLVRDSLRDIRLFDIDVSRIKEGINPRERGELLEDARNLSLVISRLIKDKETKRRLVSYLHDLFPFVEEIGTERFFDGSTIFHITEQYQGLQKVPATYTSDGTISLIAYVVILFFDEHGIVLFEEPAKYIHPHLVSKFFEYCTNAAGSKQIVLTTHNLELIRQAGLDNLYIFKKSREGHTSVTRPEENQEIIDFLKDDIGIDELLAQNLV